MKEYKRHILHILAGLSAAVCSVLAGCSGFNASEEYEDDEVTQVKTLETKRFALENNSKNIVLEVLVTGDIGSVALDSDSISVKCEELNHFGKPLSKAAQPFVTSIRNSATDLVIDNHLYMNVLVDLTLPKDDVETEKRALMQMRELFPPDNLSVVFLTEKGVSEALPATDYVIDNYCVVSNGTGIKKLYKSLTEHLKASTNTSCPEFKDSKNILVAFSDGKTYSNNKPIDPEHFTHQQELMELCSSLGHNITLCYVNCDEQSKDNDAKDLIRKICDNAGGLYQDRFNWSEIEKHIFKYFDIEYSDYTIVLTNPDKKLYDGMTHTIRLQFVNGDKVVAELEVPYSEGCFYKPVVVNGRSFNQVIWFGIILSFGLLVFVYFLLQIFIPKIRKIIFNRKYVCEYKANMSISGVFVDKSCYYCKAPFQPGDRIVAKCSHTMHEQCWNENGYHCPEFGRNCKSGSHYYNPNNLLDPDNASFHMPWILLAIAAGTLTWILFSTIEKGFFANILTIIILKLLNIQEGTAAADEFIRSNIDSLDLFPSFGLFMGLLLTFAMSILTVHKKNWLLMGAECLLRSLIAGLLGYLFFLLGCVASILIGNNYIDTFIDWIPWALTGNAIALCSSIGTSTKPRRYWILASVIIGILSMYIWEIILARIGIDYTGWLLLCHVIYSIGIALSIAHAAPVSESYFLHVSGAIKEMDIAIYKWFEANSNRVVTIGRSVDCDLMMSWDVNGDIAPVQANLTKKGHRIYLTPLEDGVMYKGKMLATGKPFRLSHGKTFTIGKTEIVFEEKDI